MITILIRNFNTLIFFPFFCYLCPYLYDPFFWGSCFCFYCDFYFYSSFCHDRDDLYLYFCYLFFSFITIINFINLIFCLEYLSLDLERLFLKLLFTLKIKIVTFFWENLVKLIYCNINIKKFWSYLDLGHSVFKCPVSPHL